MTPFHASGHPLQGPKQSFEDHQADMARWLGYDSVSEMSNDHDPLHAEMAQWFGATSFSLLVAQGVQLSPELQRLADLEENACLHLQRWMRALHNAEQDTWVRF